MNPAALREKSYFDQRATQEMQQHLRAVPHSIQETMAHACRILAMTEQEAGLAGQISVRSERPGAYWTLRFGLGFDEATPADFIEVDRDLHTLTGEGMANRHALSPVGVRGAARRAIHHPHSLALGLGAGRRAQPLVIAQMDMTPLHDDCAFLGEWPGVPIADQEGVLISEALGAKRAIILAHHGYLTAGASCEEATYLSVYLERAARMQIRAQAFGPLTPVDDALAREAHDYLLKPAIVRATFDYWVRQTRGIPALPA